jgi:hypothetical protein
VLDRAPGKPRAAPDEKAGSLEERIAQMTPQERRAARRTFQPTSAWNRAMSPDLPRRSIALRTCEPDLRARRQRSVTERRRFELRQEGGDDGAEV